MRVSGLDWGCVVSQSQRRRGRSVTHSGVPVPVGEKTLDDGAADTAPCTSHHVGQARRAVNPVRWFTCAALDGGTGPAT